MRSRGRGRATVDDVIARLRDARAMLVFADIPSPRDRHAMTDAIVALADLVGRGCVSSEVAAAIVDDISRVEIDMSVAAVVVRST